MCWINHLWIRILFFLNRWLRVQGETLGNSSRNFAYFLAWILHSIILIWIPFILMPHHKYYLAVSNHLTIWPFFPVKNHSRGSQDSSIFLAMIPFSVLKLFIEFFVLFLKQSVGCDLQLNSELKIDACGVCGGDGSTCAAVVYQWQYGRPLTPCSVSCGSGIVSLHNSF